MNKKGYSDIFKIRLLWIVAILCGIGVLLQGYLHGLKAFLTLQFWILGVGLYGIMEAIKKLQKKRERRERLGY
ncbi:MAG: hypothetical protein WCK90_05605 [archaeon]